MNIPALSKEKNGTKKANMNSNMAKNTKYFLKNIQNCVYIYMV